MYSFLHKEKPQKIKHSWENKSPLFDMMDSLYTSISRNDEEEAAVEQTYHKSFEPLCSILDRYIYHFTRPTFSDFDIEKLDVPKSDKDIIICFSGGKDSLATALFYKNLGYNIHLYHLHGISREYFDEYIAVTELAKMLDCPYFIDNCLTDGTHEFTKHPMQNYIIANGALHYGINNNIGTNIAFGNFIDSSLDNNKFEVCACDCSELWRAYETIVSELIPDFKILTPLPNSSEPLYILESHTDLLPHTMSCVQPYEFRVYKQLTTEEEYGIKLMPHRCGRCWKCCMEYIYYADRGILEYNEEYYKFCLAILLRKYSKETNKKKIDTIEDLWRLYFYYDIRGSVAYDILKDAKVHVKNIGYKKKKQ